MRQILAIAHKSVLKALHDRMFIALTLLFLAVLPLLPVILRGDGSVAGQLRLYMSYSTNFTIVFLSLLAVFIACNALSEEITRKQIFILATKPVPRWKMVVGQWAGVTLIMAVLLSVAVMVNFIGLKWLYNRHADTLTEVQRNEINHTFFTARRAVMPESPDMERMIDESIENYRASHPDEQIDYEALHKKFERRIFYKLYCIPARYEKKWMIHDITGVKGDAFDLRFKYFASDTPDDGKITGRWLFGTPGVTEEVELFTVESPEMYHTLRIPLNTVTEDGTLQIRFANRDEQMLTVIMPDEDTIEVLYDSGSFVVNYAKGSLLIFCQLASLAAIGLLFSTFLSFPVACLMSLFMFAIGAMSAGFRQMLSAPLAAAEHGHSHAQAAVEAHGETIIDLVARKLVAVLIKGFPQFDTINPTRFLTDGRFIDADVLFWGIVIIVLVQGGIALAAGSIIFRRKELAKVIV